MDVKSLTKAEEQIMQIIWKLREAIVKDVVEQFDGSKPAYTTVATVLSVLEKKGFVSHRKIGNTKLFTPAISKAEYTKFQFSSLLGNYFGGSFPKMASFFAKENDLDISDLENIMKQAEEEMKKDQQKEN
ncbi:BlaI/MecI/CopY family transcriptional regulator [Labilibaculum sp. A4]|uniref:BlaI/MecI/CopY family transcriptional regulator n=2 Tax=Labilibaculum TaxID=2060722 RepID=A0A425YF09_9BACT|nr:MULTISPECIES: BlaI/MecI/CopY family transcriptional regulator [Labilibaculum]MBN2597597.1 BlaI/MecI/CopY family transcriptional regulator [Marinifilaceae bacterium]MDQ1772918.1 BlaI/MecI/CopY family transcriptional regulator [Labilibaculum euxinus]MUP39740.1 BlaI/MecI/CopY family transcriptional regulator [Labilibaculum euxinus]MVB08945.1 BlaI/MecI/CopY family transcriptional regulator [Labilibaculum euxinus]MWN75767.1 BlaI/MecI/CopY family transcriptional regulator [Labilibaculum euxinus]